MRKGIWGFALVAIVLLMASCSSESEYANAIPKDAAMVMSFDFKTMAEKSGINGKGGEKVVAKLTDALKSGLEGEAYKTPWRRFLVSDQAQRSVPEQRNAALYICGRV